MSRGIDIPSPKNCCYKFLPLAVARQNYPDIPFHQADMVDFDLKRQFDILTCLFSSIGYVKTTTRLNQAIQTMTRHLVTGGVLLVEPWFTPEQWHASKVSGMFIEEPNLKIARMNISEVNGRLSFFDFHYMVGTPEEINYFTERHELGLFTNEEYLEAFRLAGLEVFFARPRRDLWTRALHRVKVTFMMSGLPLDRVRIIQTSARNQRFCTPNEGPK